MGQIRMTGEIRTDYDCEIGGLPAERWAEAVFKIGEEEIQIVYKVNPQLTLKNSTNDNLQHCWRRDISTISEYLSA